MNPTVIFWPMIAHFVLVGIIYVLLGLRRRQAVRSGTARARQFKVRGDEPEMSATTANDLMNQFELPMLLHIACLGLFVTNGVSFASLALAWIFVLLRYAHAYVHVTSNNLRYRAPMFAAGFVVMALLWAWFALHLLAIV